MAAQLIGVQHTIVVIMVFAVLSTLKAQRITLRPDVNQLLVPEGTFQEVECSVTSPTSTLAGNLNWAGPGGGSVTQRTMTTDDTAAGFIIHRILSIPSFSSADAGRYVCTFEPTSGTDEQRSITFLSVTETKLESEFFWGNKTATLACSIAFTGSQLQATFDSWHKEDLPISELPDPKRFTVDPSNNTLTISKPTREDAGLYIAHFKLSGGASGIDPHNCTVEYHAAPLVLDMEKSKNVYREEDLDLKCKVKGYPKATVTWLHGTKRLNRSERIMMSDIDGYKNAHLIIKSLQDEDEGTYKCLAENAANETDEKSILVRVRDPLDWLWPLIGIIVEVVVLIVIIVVCEKLKKKKRKEE